MESSAELRGPVERFHPRVEANIMVKVLLNGRAILVKARDLSMAGLRLVGGPELSSSQVTVSLPLPGDREVVTSCWVRRRTNDGWALEFDHLDWEDLFALARFLHPRLP